MEAIVLFEQREEYNIIFEFLVMKFKKDLLRQ